MASLAEVIVEALQHYWLSPLSLTVLAVCGACIATLLYVFITNARNAKLRVSLLTGLYAVSIFFWAFIAGSLVLCVSQARMVAYARNGVPLAVFGAIVGGLVASGVISLLVWRYGNSAVIRKFAPRDVNESEAWLQVYVNLLGEFEGISRVHLRIVETNENLALAVGGNARTVNGSPGCAGVGTRENRGPRHPHEGYLGPEHPRRRARDIQSVSPVEGTGSSASAPFGPPHGGHCAFGKTLILLK